MACWYVFSGHVGHCVWPEKLWYVPAAHAVHAEALLGVSWYVPSPHAMHAGVVSVVQVPLMYAPAGHTRVHGKHADCPLADW